MLDKNHCSLTQYRVKLNCHFWRNMGGEILVPENFSLETRHTKDEKENKARMREVTFSEFYGRSIAA